MPLEKSMGADGSYFKRSIKMDKRLERLNKLLRFEDAKLHIFHNSFVACP